MANAGLMKVQVHPLLIMQMSEHYSRTKVQEQGVKKVYGVVLGQTNGRHAEAINSFTLKMYSDGELMTFNEEHMQQRTSQYQEVFPELQVIGAYCAGEDDEFSVEEKALLFKMAILNRGSDKATQLDSPLFLKLNAATAGKSRNLPLTAVEGDVNDMDRYNAIEWILVSEDSERIGVNHIAKLSTSNGKSDEQSSGPAKHQLAQSAAMKMLSSRVELIMAYIEQIENGQIEPDIEILKEANLLAQKLKSIDRYAEEFQADFEKEEKTVAMFALLPRLTQLLGKMTHVWSKLALVRTDTSMMEDSYMRSMGRWAMHPGTRIKLQASKGGNFEDDDFLDEDAEFEGEMNGPKRKMHAADSQMSSARRRDRRNNYRKPEKLFRSQQQYHHARISTDQEMEGTSSQIWIHGTSEPSTSHYVPDAPMPSIADSADTSRSDENIEEPQ